MQFHRILQIAFFDLKHNIFSTKGMFFLIPFSLFWFVMLYIFSRDSVQILDYMSFGDGQNVPSPEQLTQFTNQLVYEAVSQKYGTATADSLFLDKPRLLSFTYLCGLITMPAFAFLAGHNQLASDTHRGAFRFLLSRCTRLEIFAGRFLSSWTLFAFSWLVIFSICLSILITQSVIHYQTDINFALRLYFGVLIYGTSFIAFSSIVSAKCRSGIGALLLCIIAYVVLLIIIGIGNNYFNAFNYLSPSALQEALFVAEFNTLIMNAIYLLIYIFIFTSLAYYLFKQRNL